MNNSQKGNFGENYVKTLLESEGFVVRKATGVNGCDLIAIKKSKKLKIEVKTSANPNGIPDLHSSEFKCSKSGYYFVADYLYIVRIKGKKVLGIDVLSKKEIDKYAKNHVLITRIRPIRLQTDLKNKKVGKTIKFK